MGLALAKILAAKGAKISICDVVQANLDKASKEIATKDLLATKVDVRDIAQVESWISETVKKFGRLDGAANLAGIVGNKPGSNFVPEQDEGDWDRIIGINLTGVMHSLKAELKAMQSQSPPSGSIVNAASTAGLMGLKGHAAYVASKHGVIGLTKSCARDHGGEGIRVNAIAPGVVETPMMSEIRSTGGDSEGPEKMVKAFVPQGRVGEPEEVARLYAWLLGDESSFVNGSVYVIDGGWIAGY